MSHLLVLAFWLLPCFQQEISVSNTSHPDGSGRYSWTVFIKASNETLNSIEYLEYTLHPTFPDNVRTSKSRENGFSISTNGWGEFLIYVRIHFYNGVDVYKKYWLNLKQ
jgi:transcription initiation factor IIF auxiliary subunit